MRICSHRAGPSSIWISLLICALGCIGCAGNRASRPAVALPAATAPISPSPRGVGERQAVAVATFVSTAPATPSQAATTAAPAPVPTAPAITPQPPRRNFDGTTTLSITDGSAAPPFPYVVGAELYLSPSAPPRQLIRPANAFFACDDGFQAILSPDGRFLLYTALLGPIQDSGGGLPAIGTPFTPIIRLLNLTSGQDTVFAEGACDPVWSAHGRIAYLKGDPPARIEGDPYPVGIVVRDALSAPAAAWTSGSGEFFGLVWARGRLLVYSVRQIPPDGHTQELVAFDGPGAMRVLDSSDFAELIATSPNGNLALITSVFGNGRSPVPATARIIRIVDGSEVARLQLQAPLDNLGEGGTWDGDRVIATEGITPGGTAHPRPMIVVLSLAGERIAVEDIYRFAPIERIGPGPFVPIYQPRFLDRGGTQIGMWWGYSAGQFLACDRNTAQCLLGSPLHAPAFLLTNPRRPLP